MATVSSSAKTSAEATLTPKGRSARQMEDITQQLALQVSEQLPGILHELLQGGFDPDSQPLQLECSLTAGNGPRVPEHRLPVAAVHIGRDFTPFSARSTPIIGNKYSQDLASSQPLVGDAQASSRTLNSRNSSHRPSPVSADAPPGNDGRPAKRVRKDVGQRRLGSDTDSASLRGEESSIRRKRISDNPALQPSTFDKFVGGIWDSLYSGVRMDITEVIEQWQAIESSGQPKLLTDAEQEIAVRSDTGAFGRISILTRKISQASKTCRSLEVIIQAHWIQCFDERVNELSAEQTLDKAKRIAIAEACVDFNWSEKELRNKMAIWRGYHDIKKTGGWVALVFAGTGLYRFCKYRVSFSDESFGILRALRHRLEVAADTLHPRWRILLSIVEEPTAPRYKGHPHDWVVNGPGNEAIPLPQTYHQWDKNFSYLHLDSSIIDEEAWGQFDPRIVAPEDDSAASKCQPCGQRQSDSPPQNSCVCYPNLYGSMRATMVPLQVFRTPNGKNNGLKACCPFETGLAVGEFVGQITSGLEGMDVMVGETHRATYQIWQGKQGNHTRFVNHSCRPNSHFERFVWLGKQRIVLVSRGIEADEEVTVDYGQTYWQNLDKECKCGHPGCRYQNRDRHLITPPEDE
ncbi:hypothetical protein LTR37_020077 [Vermiconidia calcicola]|uniref:Uncharacterized protein n=1 Tax=Vermiconidia calcicola TaxID=1690605 RepID=A0ACC3MCG1_9PEZI|nr:hypothetical protein LTR37_020077 [Vermiconidia calcicola]